MIIVDFLSKSVYNKNSWQGQALQLLELNL